MTAAGPRDSALAWSLIRNQAVRLRLIAPDPPWLSIRAAVLTVSPHKSKDEGQVARFAARPSLVPRDRSRGQAAVQAAPAINIWGTKCACTPCPIRFAEGIAGLDATPPMALSLGVCPIFPGEIARSSSPTEGGKGKLRGK